MSPVPESPAKIVRNTAVEEIQPATLPEESEVTVSVSLRHLRKVLEVHDRSRARIGVLKGELAEARSQALQRAFPVTSSEHEFLLQSFTQKPNRGASTSAISSSRPICRTNPGQLQNAGSTALSQPETVITPSRMDDPRVELTSSSSTMDAVSGSFEAAMAAKVSNATKESATLTPFGETTLVRGHAIQHEQDENGVHELQTEANELAWQRVSEAHAAAVEVDKLQQGISLQEKAKRPRTEDSESYAETLLAYAGSAVKRGKVVDHTSSSLRPTLDHRRPGDKECHVKIAIGGMEDRTLFEVSQLQHEMIPILTGIGESEKRISFIVAASTNSVRPSSQSDDVYGFGEETLLSLFTTFCDKDGIYATQDSCTSPS